MKICHSQVLRESNIDVISIAETYQGISDKEVIELAQKENLIILTFDKDYGELIFKYNLEVPPAVVYFRFRGDEPSFAGRLLVDLIASEKIRLEKIFTVIEQENVRQRHYL